MSVNAGETTPPRPVAASRAVAGAERLGALTSLRFVAAMAVVLHHLADFTPHAPSGAFATRGGLAVDFFFILSGFILTHAHLAELRAGTLKAPAFLWARLARIYPAHLAMLALFGVTIGLAAAAGQPINAERYGARSLLTHLLLINAWGVETSLTWNYPAWSISAEWAAYLAFPAMAWGALRLPRGLAVAALGALLACFLLLAPRYGWTQRTVDNALPRIFFEFAMGMLARLVWPPRPERLAAPAALAGAGAVAAGLWAGIGDAWLVAAFLLIVVAAGRLDGPLDAALSAPAFVRLGEESYALYLAHVFVFGIVFRLGGLAERLGAPGWLSSLAAILAALAAARLLHRFVETPANRWLRGHAPRWARAD